MKVAGVLVKPKGKYKSIFENHLDLASQSIKSSILGRGYLFLMVKWICKRGIFENVNVFLKWVEKGADTLTQEDLDNEENDIEEEENQSEEIETQNISNKLQIEISQIENW
ncbi:hypothetical protein Glove_166g14 [Diversispora epigaea]|uniref:Uncharacterized protein n=1 Tax=Diversispora epigaea TaxID=1348612 RepID=A0A397IYZ2_9GLOM|nr:hypothetical protein Glove_166g14 [Diversispora epigaea]